MRIGIDAMGSDRAPAVEVQGALAAREVLSPGDRLVLVGRQADIRKELDGQNGWQDFIDIHHAEQVVTMDESPVESLRTKPDNSMAVLTRLAKEGKLDACVSAGNTGAFAAAAQMHLRRLPGVHRPGIAVASQTPKGSVVLCEVGANLYAKPQHLHQYGVMASLYSKAIVGVQNPRVGLMSVGEEDAKGNELVKAANALLRADPHVNFIGNIEGRDIFTGVCDVIVCDGFVGNVVLKVMEGIVGIIKSLLGEVKNIMPPAGAGVLAQAAGSVMKKFDFNEYGGAPLLGVGGIVIICHGASSARGIRNAVRAAKEFSRYDVNHWITEFLSTHAGEADG